MNWYEMDAQHALAQQQVDAKAGLSRAQVEQRRAQYGQNELRQGKKRTVLKMILEQLSDFMVIVLIVAAVISAVLGEVADSVVILLVVVLNAVMGVIQESRAEASLEKLKQMASPHATVLRDGVRQRLEAHELVPGDIVLLETGDYVPADLRIIESVNLQIQESALTGESEPVSKKTTPLPEGTSLGDRVNMGFSSSLVTYGRGTGVAVETGMRTEIGRIAKLLDEEEGVKTPLQIRLADLGKKLGIAALLICLLIFIVGLLYGHEALHMFMTAVSLAVAAIPEGLPATVTIVLAVGVKRMISRNTIIRRLPAVETLGSASVVCSDKTGTLTLNRMTVTAATLPYERVELGEIKHHPGWVMLGSAAVLCNDAQVGEGVTLGDPTETALIDFAGSLSFVKVQMDKTCPRVDEIPFDSQRKRMTTVNRSGNELIVYVKGAVDEMLPLITMIADGREVRPITDADKRRIIQSTEKMGADALRVLGFAMKRINQTVEADKLRAYESELTFLGMLGMIDPPRPEARQAVAQCRRAGIIPVMITGDHAVTASAIATDLGMLPEGGRVVTGTELTAMTDEQLSDIVRDVRVYARVSPEHKVRIVRAWQQHGNVCAMTGDGVNDAPALKRADIGVAMGITGTEVAKEASAMIITDDNFATIVAAVEEGRTIYANIIKAVQYLLSCNLGEIITLFVATMLNWTSPLLPIHILWVNLVTDSLPALALGMDPAEPDVMDRPPRNSKEGFLNRGMALRLSIQGLLIGLVTLCAFGIGLRVSTIMGQTMAFTVLSLSQLVHSFNQRSNRLSIFKIGVLSNKWLGRAVLASLALQLVVLFTPALREIFHLATMHYVQWLMVIMLSFVPLLAVELLKWLKLARD